MLFSICKEYSMLEEMGKMMSTLKTKKQILDEGGYIAQSGRRQKYGEPTVVISFRLAKSKAEKLGKNRNEVAKNIVLEHLPE
jgi:hypothetical protein